MPTWKFGIARKLFAVCSAFALPILVMFVLMTQAKLAEIAFTSKELEGDAYQRPLQDVFQHVSTHQRLSARRKRGDSTLDSRIRAEESAVATALRHLDAADLAHGKALQFTPEGLGLRRRNAFTASGLRQKWAALVASAQTLSPAMTNQQYVGVVQHVRTMITHAGDTSNLILDPDLDSYYLMDATLLALPQMEDRLHQIATEVDALARARELGPDGAIQLATLSAFLREADWQRVVASCNTSINEDPNFHGESPTLATELTPRLQAVRLPLGQVLEGLRALATSHSSADFTIATVEADLGELEAALYDLHRAALGEEDRLLQIRVSDFRRSLRLGCAFAAAALLLSGLLAFALANNITRRVLRVSATTKAFAAGDMTVRVGSAGSDELGELGESFDNMADRIGRLASEVRLRADELAKVNSGLEAAVDARTRELRRRNDAFALILDNAHDGMLTVDLDGVMSRERSAAVLRWFGPPAVNATFPEYLGAGDALLAAELASGLEELRADIMPLEVVLDQLPRRAFANGAHLQLAYQPIVEHGRVSHLLIVISDITSELANQRSAALQAETVRIFHACQRDRSGFLDFFVNAREIVQQLSSKRDRGVAEIGRDVHTLKGNCALFGVFSMSGLCHEVESGMADNGGVPSSHDIGRVVAAWNGLSLNIQQIVGDQTASRLEVGDDEYATIVDAVARGAPRRDILVAIAKWKLEPTARRLSRFAERAQSLARRAGKDIKIDVEPNDLRLCAETLAPVWATLSHVVRNAIDHGIEPATERTKNGKSAAGHLTLRTLISGGCVWLEVSDDGRGIPWANVAAAAATKGLAHATRRDLIEALFTDGISTAEVVTELSGRGVGMSAVRDACSALGGTVELESEAGRGTTIRCGFPEELMGGKLLVSVHQRQLTRSLAPAS